MPPFPSVLADRQPHRSLVRAEGRDPEVVAFEQSLLGFFIEAADLLGVPKSLAAIYGLCFASPKPLGFSDIQERLEISAGSISQGLRILREVGALRSVSPPGDRREQFEPDLELRKLMTHYIRERLHKQLNSGRNRLQDIAKTIPGGRNGSARVLRKRLKTLQSWHNRTLAVLPLVNAFLKLP